MVVPGAVGKGDAELGMASADQVSEANNKNLRLVEVGNNILCAVITGANSGIKTMAYLKGKRLQRIRPGTTTEVPSAGILRAIGLDPEKDVVSLRAESSSKALDDVSEGKADAAFNTLGGAKMEEFDKNIPGGSYVVPFPQDKFELVKKTFPYMKLVVVKAGSYPGVKKDTAVLAWPIVLITNASVPDNVVYTVVKTLMDQQKELEKVHQLFKEWTLAGAAQSDAAPFHTGAIKYYNEKGIWKDEKVKVKEPKPKKK